jgi:hypothetical protein
MSSLFIFFNIRATLIKKNMKLIFENLNDSPLNLLRRAGYAFLRKDEKTGEFSLVKRVSNADFPRFHIYVKNVSRTGGELNLHLDQKRASYKGTIAHSGEYSNEENKWLAQEAELIKKEFG